MENLKEVIVVKLNELIKEGHEVKQKCYKNSYGSKGYLSGQDYSAWVQKCRIFINNNCNDQGSIEMFNKLVQGYNRDSLDAYVEMMAMLEAIKDSEDLILYKATNDKTINRKIFISHSSKNKIITDKFANILKRIGVNDNQIYYSSFVETGAKYLDDCFTSITKEFKENEIMVIFMLSREFYASDICLAEMGATWVTTENYIPVILPPLGYDDIKGVIKSTQNGILLTANDISQRLDTLKETIQTYLEIENNLSAPEWTREKDEFINIVKDVQNKNNNIEVKINDIKINQDSITLKLLIENNTKLRYECESAKVHLKLREKKDVVKNIEDWSIQSIVIQSLERITFFVSFKLDEQVKRSEIILEESKAEIVYYPSN